MIRSKTINIFSIKIETDWDIAKGRSLSSYETAGVETRKKINQFQKTLDGFTRKSNDEEKKFRKTLYQSNKNLMNISKGKMGKEKKNRE